MHDKAFASFSFLLVITIMLLFSWQLFSAFNSHMLDFKTALTELQSKKTSVLCPAVNESVQINFTFPDPEDFKLSHPDCSHHNPQAFSKSIHYD